MLTYPGIIMTFRGKKSVKGPSKTFGKSQVTKSKTTEVCPKKVKYSLSNSSKIKKKNNSDNSDIDTGTDSDSDESDASEVEIKFELFNMAEADYHSIKQYLGNLFGAGDHGVDCVALTSFIVEDLADHLGTCVKTDGETSDPFGFISGFPLSLFLTKENENISSSNVLNSISKYLKDKCKGFDVEGFFSEPKNVIIFQERLINVPGTIAAPLYRQFLDDWVMAASEKELNQKFSKLKNVLFITPTYREIVSNLDRELGLQEDPTKFGVTSTETNFYYEEAEFLPQFSSNSFIFSVNTGHETSDSRRAFSDVGIEPGRMAFVLSWEKFSEYINFLQTNFD